MKAFIFFGLLGYVFCVGSYRTIESSKIPDVVLSSAQESLAVQNMVFTEKTLDMFRAGVVNAEEQLVAGKNYRFSVQLHTDSGIQECKFLIFYQSWTNTISVNPDHKCTLIQVKRQVGGFMAGGVSSADCNGDQFQAVLPEAVKSVNMMSNSLFHMTPIQMSKCTQQVIRGIRYTFNVDFQQAEKCMNDQEHLGSLLGDCPPANGATHTDHFHCTVIDVAWETPRYTTDCQLVH